MKQFLAQAAQCVSPGRSGDRGHVGHPSSHRDQLVLEVGLFSEFVFRENLQALTLLEPQEGNAQEQTLFC